MSKVDRTQRKQLIREAEGYLELMTALEDHLSLALPLRESLADRVIQTLSAIESPQGFKPYMLYLKGQACRAADRFEDAIGYLDQSARLDPDNLHTQLGLAWCYKRTMRLTEAIDAMRLAVQIDSDSAIAHYNLACYLSLGGRLLESVDQLSIALELDNSFRDKVLGEHDFDPIRHTPEFLAALTVNV
jgi:tetratricopeptide (TPR) repeat protein